MTNDDKKPAGDAILRAYGRQGLAEIRAALFPSHPVPTDPGMWGNLTPGEVADQRKGESKDDTPEQQPADRDDVLGKYTARDTGPRAIEREPDSKNCERDALERE